MELVLNGTVDKNAELKRLIVSEFAPRIGGKNIVYVDYPFHLNVGDLLIQKGTELLFEQLSSKVISRINTKNDKRLHPSSLDANDVIVLHGGGNFGDIYRVHQELRNRVVQQFPDNPIIVMPQSVQYSDKSLLESELKAYKAHSNLTLYVRDQVSFDTLKPYLKDDQLKMLPDMAFTLADSFKTNSQNKAGQILSLRRRDVEAVGQENGFDWDELYSNRDMVIFSTLNSLARFEQKLKRELGLAWLWNKYLEHTIDKAVHYFNQYSTVDTDRLHGMILGLLLNKSVVVRDNSYGKLRRFANAWLI